jgi:hypothetical protein
MAAIRATEAGPLFTLGALGLAITALLGGCASGSAAVNPGSPVPEKELAMRRLQQPLDQHLCKVAIYPTAGRDWQLERLQGLAGRGQSFAAALESLCREGEGRRAVAIVDLYYQRLPNGWSSSYEVHGTAVRFDAGFAPPPAPNWESIRPPEMPTNLDAEPAPQGEGASSPAARNRGKGPSLRNHAAIPGPRPPG